MIVYKLINIIKENCIGIKPLIMFRNAFLLFHSNLFITIIIINTQQHISRCKKVPRAEKVFSRLRLYVYFWLDFASRQSEALIN